LATPSPPPPQWKNGSTPKHKRNHHASQLWCSVFIQPELGNLMLLFNWNFRELIDSVSIQLEFGVMLFYNLKIFLFLKFLISYLTFNFNINIF
jgi:hypothetical protein